MSEIKLTDPTDSGVKISLNFLCYDCHWTINFRLNWYLKSECTDAINKQTNRPLTDITYVETSLSQWIMCHACYTRHSPTHIWNKTIYLVICRIKWNVGTTIYYERESWWKWPYPISRYDPGITLEGLRKKHKNISISINNSTDDSYLLLPNWQSSSSVCWQQIKHIIKISHLQHPVYKEKYKISCKYHKYLHPPTAV